MIEPLQSTDAPAVPNGPDPRSIESLPMGLKWSVITFEVLSTLYCGLELYAVVNAIVLTKGLLIQHDFAWTLRGVVYALFPIWCVFRLKMVRWTYQVLAAYGVVGLVFTLRFVWPAIVGSSPFMPPALGVIWVTYALIAAIALYAYLKILRGCPRAVPERVAQ